MIIRYGTKYGNAKKYTKTTCRNTELYLSRTRENRSLFLCLFLLTFQFYFNLLLLLQTVFLEYPMCWQRSFTAMAFEHGVEKSA